MRACSRRSDLPPASRRSTAVRSSLSNPLQFIVKPGSDKIVDGD
jgi:hypothetical protein